MIHPGRVRFSEDQLVTSNRGRFEVACAWQGPVIRGECLLVGRIKIIGSSKAAACQTNGNYRKSDQHKDRGTDLRDNNLIATKTKIGGE